MKFSTMMAAVLLTLAADSQAALIHQYELNGSLADNKGGSALVSLQGVLGANDYAFKENKGLRLDYALGGVYSIDMSFRLDKLENYSRIVDFMEGSSDTGLYASLEKFVLWPSNSAGGALKVGTFSHVTLTRDSNNFFKIYQDGKLVVDLHDSNGVAKFSGNSAYFFRDNGADYATGAVDFIHVYDHVLSQAEVSALNSPAAVPEPASLGLLGAGLALMGWTRRRQPRTAA